MLVARCWFLVALSVVTLSAADSQLDDRIRALIAQGDAFADEATRRFDLALDRYHEADRLAAGSPDLRLRATARQRVGQLLFESDRLMEAVAAGREAADLARRADAPGIIGAAYRIVGGALLQLGRFEEADVVLNEAATISAAYGTTDEVARAFNNLCANARLQGNLDGAIAYGRRALGVVDDAMARGETLSARSLFAVPFNLGKAMADGGDYQGSRAYLDRAFATAERLGDIGGQMHVLFDTGEWYDAQGDQDRARRYYERALEFTRRQVSGEEAEGKSLRGLGRIALADGRRARAVELLEESVRVFEARELEYQIPVTLVDLARARQAVGDSSGARRDLERAIDSARRRRHSVALVLALVERGRQRTSVGLWREAAADFDEAAAEAKREGLLPLAPAAWAGRAALAETQGDLTTAVAAYDQAADALDAIRGRIVSLDLRASFASATHETFAGMVRVLMRLHFASPDGGFGARALMALERERSQALALAVRESAAAPTAAAPAEKRITQIQNALFVQDLADTRRRGLLTALDDAERDLTLADRGRPAAVRTETSMRDLQAALREDEAVVEYLVAPPQPAAFIVRRDSMRVVPLDLPADLDARVAFFVRALQGNVRDASLASGAVLSAALLDSVLAAVPPASRLLFVTSGPLAHLPFGALPIAGRPGAVAPLIASHDVSYVASLGLFERHRSASPATLERSALTVADSAGAQARQRGLTPLPGTRAEARAVSRHFRAVRALRGSDATEHAVKTAGGHATLHFATHAVLDPLVPERSAILLGASEGEDGLFQAREIYQMPMRGSLVVLSGCRTADGQWSGAEGLRSLSRAFLQAGGRAVVGALWDLPDAGTAPLVVSFYDTLERADAGSALRAAQLAIAGRDPYASSRTWAAMVILGDPSIALARESGLPVNAVGAATVALLAVGGLACVLRRNPHARQR